MARLNHPGTEHVYAAAQLFVENALKRDDSLFTPGHAIWSLPVINDLYHRFVEQPDTSSDKFETKLGRQLQGSAPDTIQLAGELLFVYLLIARDVSGARKRELINTVLQWSPAPVQIPKELDMALDTGICSTGIIFHAGRPYQLAFLLEFVRRWKGLSHQEQARAVADPWVFKQLVVAAHVPASQPEQAALTHLVYPDIFGVSRHIRADGIARS